MSNIKTKQTLYGIFNEIQTRTDTKENLQSLYELFEATPIQEFNECLENVFLIIFYNYEKNTLPLKNIREFLKSFIEKISKSQKLKKNTKEFLNYFCNLFTLNAKKIKYKSLSIYFLTIFLLPYTNGNILLYESETLEEIKNYILNILKGKQTVLIQSVLHFLEKHPSLQKDSDVWERLEMLLNGTNKTIKREIIKLFENSNANITKYLLDMYDDESSEIRQFAFEKLCRVQNFHTIDSKVKVKIFFVGLGDTSPKIQEYGKKLLKNYMTFLGIIKAKSSKEKDNDRMDIDDEDTKKKLFDEEEDNEDKNENSSQEDPHDTAQSKIQKATSPMKPKGKKLTDSPSRIFDELDVISYYNHPKFSYVYTLITDAMMEIIDQEDIVNFCKDIIENFTSIINKIGEIKQFSTEKKRRSSFSSSGKEKIDKYALFNDIYFLQNVLTLLTQNKDSVSFKSDIIDLLPDGSTFAKILAHFYISQPNIFILHQLLLISLNMPFQDEIGNREIFDFIKKFISDISLANKKISDFSFRKLNFNRLDSKPEDNMNEYGGALTVEKQIDLEVNNCLLPSYRKIILSMEDLVEYCLKILKIIYAGKDTMLFAAIMETVNELNDIVDMESENSIKKKQSELIEALKEKIALVESLEEKANTVSGEERIEVQKQLLSENKQLSEVDAQLIEITKKEGNVLYRIINLCRFAINNCKLHQSSFDNMVTKIIIPSLKKSQFPSVVHLALESTGLLAINNFSSTYKNFLKLFFDTLSNDECEEFKETNKIALTIILDSIMQNNIFQLPQEIMDGTIDSKIQIIIDKYLYHQEYTPRILAFMGICKLLIVDRLTKHEFLLSRLFVALYKSFDIFDKPSEEYNVKIYEIMNNFMFFYSSKGKKRIYSVLKAINIILTSQMFFNNETIYDRSILSDYSDTKIDFLNRFLIIVYENSNEKTNLPFMKLIFKLVKYLFFLYRYAKEEDVDGYERKNQEHQKTIDIGINLLKNLKVKLDNFFIKTGYDKALIAYFKENDSKFYKLYALWYSLNELKVLNEFSPEFGAEFSAIQEKNSKIELNGTMYDFSSEEKKKELLDYVDKKEKKYYEEIEEFYSFCMTLKENKLKRLFKENSKITEVKEEDENVEEEKEEKKRGRKKKKVVIEEEPREPKKSKITPKAKRSTRKK